MAIYIFTYNGKAYELNGRGMRNALIIEGDLNLIRWSRT